METSQLYSLVARLESKDEQERVDAVYRLEVRDKRALPHLLRVLLDKSESPQVRAQAAENLKEARKRRAMKALVECSADESPEVRFWCVFALGSSVRRRRRRITPRIVIQALEMRLGDTECPDDRGNWWPVGLEALAMLQSYKGSRGRHVDQCRDTILEVMRDPLADAGQRKWADCYWHERIAR